MRAGAAAAAAEDDSSLPDAAHLLQPIVAALLHWQGGAVRRGCTGRVARELVRLQAQRRLTSSASAADPCGA